MGVGDAERGHVAGTSPHQSLVLQTPSFPVSLRPHQEHQVEGQSVPLGPEPREIGAQRERDPGGEGALQCSPCGAPQVAWGKPHAEIKVAGVASLEYDILKVRF